MVALSDHLADNGLADAADVAVINIFFTTAAAGTPWTPILSQRAAAGKVLAVQGTGSYSVPTALINGLLESGDGVSNTTNAILVRTLLTTYWTNIPAAADAARAITFAVAGIAARDVVAARLIMSTGATNARNHLGALLNVGPLAVKKPTDTLVYATDTLAIFPAVGSGLVVGSFTLTDVLDVPDANTIAQLQLFVR